jgi:hypothetical protein
MRPVLDVTQERTEKDVLRYPTHSFAVWRDGQDGSLPYHQDTDSYEYLSQALQEACTWVCAAAGNEACVINRVTGRLMARYRQSSSGALGYVFYSPQGRVIQASNRHLFKAPVVTDRTNIAETLVVDGENTRVCVEWSEYAPARRYLLTSLRERGEQVDALKPKTLQALLHHYGLDLIDEVTGYPGVNIGTVLFPRESYDAGSIRYLLSCMSRFVYSGSNLVACLGGRQVKITFGWRDYLNINPTEEQKELDRVAQTLQPCYHAVAPDGLSCDVRSLLHFDATALDVLLWHLLFCERKGEQQGNLGEDDEMRATIVGEAADLVVPRPEEEDRLLSLIQLEPRFFTTRTIPISTSLSPAHLTQLNVHFYVKELYNLHWDEVMERVRTALVQK